MSEVSLPVVGKVKSGWLIGGIAIVAVIVGYAYLKNRNASPGSGTTAAADNAGTAQIDPQTGYPYGSAEDTAALAQLQGYGAGSMSAGYGDGEYYGAPATTAASAAAPNSGPGTFTDNAYWLQYCEQALTGYTPAQVQAALSAYLAGMPLTAAQYAIYQQALGVAGPPPNPPATPAQPASPSSPAAPAAAAGTVKGEVSGLRAVPGQTSVALSWQDEKGATGYKVTVLHGASIIESETVSQSTAEITGLARKTSYHFRVQAQPPAGAGYATVTATTS